MFRRSSYFHCRRSLVLGCEWHGPPFICSIEPDLVAGTRSPSKSVQSQTLTIEACRLEPEGARPVPAVTSAGSFPDARLKHIAGKGGLRNTLQGAIKGRLRNG